MEQNQKQEDKRLLPPEQLNFIPEPGYLAIRPTIKVFDDSKILLTEETKRQITNELLAEGTLANEIVAVGPSPDPAHPASFKVGEYVIYDMAQAAQGSAMKITVEGFPCVLIPMSLVLGRVKDVAKYLEFEKRFLEKNSRLQQNATPARKKASNIVTESK